MGIFWFLLQYWTIKTVFAGDDALFGTSPRAHAEFMDLAKMDGYKAEQFTVTTEDGYILKLFHIPVKKSCKNEIKDTILFFHGLYLSGDDCIIPGPGKAHCYIYADACHDVWVGNIRGCKHGRNHTTLNPDKDKEFWNFAIEEVAVRDLPAIIDYILLQTGKKQIAFVGHSQGVSLLILLSLLKPEFNSKIKVAFGLSPAVWLKYASFIVIKLQGIISPLLTLAKNIGIETELFGFNKLTQRSGDIICGKTNLTYPLCSNIIFAVFGYNNFQITKDVLPVVFGHQPSGTSLALFNRWGEIVNYGFSKKNYGPAMNLVKYGSTEPPLYDTSQVHIPWIFFCAKKDNVGTEKDLDISTPQPNKAVMS